MFLVSADEPILLMQFLDNVFPLQYPMYRPGISDGGRGWLLALLVRTKPLYHAALALSACHRRTMILGMSSCRTAALVQQEKHLEICIQLLKSASESGQYYCPKNGLGLATAVVQLVFFEVCFRIYHPGPVLTTFV